MGGRHARRRPRSARPHGERWHRTNAITFLVVLIVAALLAHGAVKVIGDGESKDGLHQVKFFNHGMQKTKKKDAPVMPPLPFCTMPPAGAEGAAPNPNPNPKAEPNPNPNPNPSGDLDPNLDPSPYANPNPNPNPSPDPKPLPVRGGLKPNPHVELTLQAVAAVVVSGDRAPLAALPNQINPAALNCELDATRRRWLRHAAFNSKPKPSPDPNPNPNPSLARADYVSADPNPNHDPNPNPQPKPKPKPIPQP